MLDSEGYNIKYVQKSSPGKSDDFIFAHIFKFHTCDGMKYIIRAEMHNFVWLTSLIYPELTMINLN